MPAVIGFLLNLLLFTIVLSKLAVCGVLYLSM